MTHNFIGFVIYNIPGKWFLGGVNPLFYEAAERAEHEMLKHIVETNSRLKDYKICEAVITVEI